MATKLQTTPTTNVFALLADEQASSQPPKKKTEAAPAAKNTQELTPAARAAVKAEEERRKKEAAEKRAKQQQAAAAAVATVNPEDLEGFGLQRNQRVKEKRFAPQEVPKETNKFNKGDKKPFKKNFNNEKNDNKPFQESNRPAGFKSDKPQRDQKPQEGGRPPRRDFDKQSQGKYPRQPYAKRQGHGKNNWGDEEDIPTTAPEVTEPISELVVSVEPTETEEAPIFPDENQEPVESEVAFEDVPEPEPVEIGLEEYLQLKALKQEELKAKVGGIREGPRELTDDEKKKHQKFTALENEKTKIQIQDVKVQKSDASVARKGTKPVAPDSYFNFSIPGGRGDGRGEGRGEGRGGRGRGEGRGNRGPGGENRSRGPKGPGGRGGNKAGPKIVRNDAQFPSLA